jgi:aspartate kinase
VALAAALGADCEIYSDVDGVYSADPRVVAPSNLQHLPFVGYGEMQELAEHGARVLNAQAVEWAKKANIVIHARATAGSAKETIISERHEGRAVTGTKRITRVTGGRDPLRIVEEERIALRQGTREVLRFVRDDVPDWPRVEKRFLDDGAELVEEGAVTLVGPGIDAALIRRVLTVNPAAWEHAPLRLTVYVECDRVDEVTRALHDMMRE